MIIDRVIENIDNGRDGLNVGIPINFPKLTNYIPNIQKGTYYLVGASTGCGKTTLTDKIFLYDIYDFLLRGETDIKVVIDYFSFEIDKEEKLTKGVCKKLFNDYGIVTNPDYILSRGKNRISGEIYEKVLSVRRYFEPFEDLVTIFDIPENPTGINKTIYQRILSNGEILQKEIDIGGEKRKVFDRYVPKDPNLYYIIIIDHIALMHTERGFNTKDNIDKMSQYLVQLRKNFNIIPVVVQQLNYDINDPARVKIGRLTPLLSDFGDSKYTTRDCQVCLSLFNPFTFNLPTFSGYDTAKLKDRFRSLEILKARNGGVGNRFGLFYLGECGHFQELPRADEMRISDYEKLIKM